MKRTLYLLFISLFVGIGYGCSNDGSEEELLKLTPSKTSLTANGTDQVTFTVTQQGLDVTSEAELYLIETDGQSQETKLDKAAFTTLTAGRYTFQARYNGLTSPKAVLTATEGAAQDEKFYRRIAILEGTGTGCPNCPRAVDQINDLSGRKFPNRLVVLAFHGYNSTDPMFSPQTIGLVKKFSLNGYPFVITDLRVGVSGDALYNTTVQAIEESLSTYPATCGLRIESRIEDGQIKATVGITSNTGGNYSLGVYVVENRIRYPQHTGSLIDENYIHNHAVRRMLSKATTGDPLKALAANEEQTASYTTSVDPAWATENLKIVVYAVDQSGFINNVAECDAENGSVPYEYNEK